MCGGEGGDKKERSATSRMETCYIVNFRMGNKINCEFQNLVAMDAKQKWDKRIDSTVWSELDSNFPPAASTCQ